MAKFVIKGGRPIDGEIRVSGAKNGALKAFAASFLFQDLMLVEKVPQIEDIFRMKELLTDTGVKIKESGNNALSFSAPQKIKAYLNHSKTKKLRASVALLGPILARYGKISMSHPGGCVIGKRPINFFIDGFRAMGAEVKENGERYFFEAKKLRACEFTFPVPSVTATESLMMAATLADGKVVLKNCACEPEIESLANFLNKSGAKINGAGTHTIIVDGLGRYGFLQAKTPFEVIPDRIEAGSMLILGALLAKNLKITNCKPEHLTTLMSHLESAGVQIKSGKDWVSVSRPHKLLPIDIKTSEYPGFATDLQAPFTVLLTQAEGESRVHETIFEGRLDYVSELVKMGANIISCDPHRIIVLGSIPLYGRELKSPDLRAGLAFIIAGLIAKGETIVHNVYNIDRGYEDIELKLSSVGADIKRVD